MFGKPEWFKATGCGCGLHPITWQGWLYTLAWSGVLVAPTFGLMCFDRYLEAVVWFTFSATALLLDAYAIQKAKQAAGRAGVEGVPACDAPTRAAPLGDEPVLAEKAEPPALKPRAEEPELFYIGDDDDNTRLATRNYEMRLRR